MNRHIIALVAILLLTACATSSGVMQLSQNTYMISKTSAAGAFASQAGMQAKVIKEANEFAASKGKVAVAQSTHWDRPNPGFPTFTYTFVLVDESDPRAKDVKLEPRADVVIEDRRK